MKIEVVIPVGPGDPQFDMPDTNLLIEGLESIRNQTQAVYLTCAVDKNLSEKKIRLIRQYVNKIKFFPPHSYYRAGGIWNKIYSCWEESDCEYVAWNGYDDLSSPDRFEKQLAEIEATQTNSCLCQSYKRIGTREVGMNDGHIDFINYLGKHPPYMGSFLIRRNAILTSGIAQYRLMWSYYFEGLLYAYILKCGMPCVSNGRFYYRVHDGTISNTVREDRDWVCQAIKEAGYTFEDCREDWQSINFPAICEEIRKGV